MIKILVPVDGSEHANHAARWAANVSARLSGAITLLYVYALSSTEAMGLANLSQDEIRQRIQQRAQPSLDAASAAIGATDVAVDTVVKIGDPADEIVAVSKERGVDHIVIGSRGLSPVRELMLGSVSEKVTRRAHCAVTVVR